MKTTPRTLSGFMELLPAEQLVFNRMLDIIRDAFESYGFAPLDTPVLEYADVLLAKAGGETEKQIYRFQKGDTDLCMRFDLTVPLSRYVAQHQNDITFPFRRYQIAKSYRGERPQKGRFREFYQADIDIIGNERLSIVQDAEVPAVMYGILRRLGLNRFRIKINNRKLLNGFYASLNLADQAPDILRVIDKYDKIGAPAVRDCLADIALSAEQIDAILSFVQTTGTPAQVLSYLDTLAIDNDAFQTGLSELKTVSEALQTLGVPETHYQIDLKITRGLDYYTGTVYETYADNHPNWGAICSGGRYDNLAENYTDRKLPGIGMSLGLTRFFDLLKSENLLNFGTATPAQVLVLPMGDDMSYALKTADLLRRHHIRTELYGATAKFKNKMAYANKIGVPFVAILGEDEEKTNTVSLKDMASGTQTTVPLADLPDFVLREWSNRPIPPVIRDTDV